MAGRAQVGVSIAAAGALLAVLLAPGSAGARGGNHGCSAEDGSAFSSHYHESGDNIVVGHYRYTPTLGDTTDSLVAQNTPTEGGTPSTIQCSDDPDGWVTFSSELGPGADSLRLDAQGLSGEYNAPPQELPAAVVTEISGGGAGDTIRGHDGVDEIRGDSGGDVLRLYRGRDLAVGGDGRDLIKAAGGGRDTVKCGPGSDEATVDRRDQVSGCEHVARR